MSKPKLETYQNKQYFVDQYCGALLDEMYSVPKNKKGDREGIFHDPAVALRYFGEQLKVGTINQKKFDKIQKSIARDLHVKISSLKEAPVIDPLEPDFGFLDHPEYKKIVEGAEDVMISVKEFLEEEEKPKDKDSGEKAGPETCGFLYTVKPEDTELSTHDVEKQSEFIFKTAKAFSLITVVSYKGKKVWVITDTTNTEGKENQLAASLFNIKARGVVYLCSQKPLHASKKRKSEAELLLESATSPKKPKPSCLPLTLCGESTSEEGSSEASV